MKLGSLSARYESNGDPATVSTGFGDAGGVSYGTYQLASNTGSVKRFIDWASREGHPAAAILSRNQPGTSAFSADWVSCAKSYDDFGDLQHNYIKYAYYDPAVALLRKAHFNIEKHHEVMQDVVWSRAVQYGTGYIVEMFEDACEAMGYPNLSYIDAANFDAGLIRAIYLEVCSTEEWTSGSPSLRKGLYARFANECKDALARLG